MRDERADRDRGIESDRHQERAVRAEERKQQQRAGEAGGAGAQRIDVVEEPDGAADVTRAAHQVADQHGQRGSHQQRRYDDERKVDGRHRRQRPSGRRLADKFEDCEGAEAESGGGKLDRREQRQQRNAGPLREPAAGEAAEAKA